MKDNESGRRVTYRHFQSRLQSWESLFDDAAQFASDIGEDRLINISHSDDGGKGIVTVWYWESGSAEST